MRNGYPLEQVLNDSLAAMAAFEKQMRVVVLFVIAVLFFQMMTFSAMMVLYERVKEQQKFLKKGECYGQEKRL